MILNSGRSSIHEIYELGISREPTRNPSLLIPGLASFFFAFFAELKNLDQPKLVRGSFHLPDWHPILLCRFIPCLFFNQASSKIDQLNPREGFFSLSLKSRQNEVNKMNADRLFELLIDSSAIFTQKETEEGWHFCKGQEDGSPIEKHGLVAHSCLCLQANCFQVDSGIIKRASMPNH